MRLSYLRFPRFISALLLSIVLYQTPAFAAERTQYSIAWSIYVGWMPWDYIDKTGIMKKWADKYGIHIPVPHGFIKSVLAEYRSGSIKLWTFKMDNAKLTGAPGEYLINTYDAEQFIGGRFWDRANGKDMHALKKAVPKMW